jgi:hypothetical protein
LFSFFKSNNPAVLVFYLLYLIAFRVCFVFQVIDSGFVFNHQEPFSHFIFSLLKGVLTTQTWLSPVLSAILCFVQALLINDLVNENKILPKKNYLAGLIFIIIFSFFKQGLVFSPEAIALTFLILCTRKMFTLVRKEKASGDIFDMGFLAAISMLFYFPCIVLLPFAFIGLATLRSFEPREWAIVLTGFFSPFIMLFTWYFWNDQTSLLWPALINAQGKAWLHGWQFSNTDWLLFGSLTFLILASWAILPAALYSSLIQVRKFSTILIFLILLIIISFAFQQTPSLSHWVLLAMPLSVIFSMVWMQIKNKWVSEVIHIILILLVLGGQYLKN